METYYKVVRLENGKRFSAATFGKGRVRYKVGQFVKPPSWLFEHGYGLCVFKSFDFARWYQICSGEHAVVYTCKIGKQIPTGRFLYSSDIENGLINKKSELSLWPVGTLMTDKVKLLKRIR